MLSSRKARSPAGDLAQESGLLPGALPRLESLLLLFLLLLLSFALAACTVRRSSRGGGDDDDDSADDDDDDDDDGAELVDSDGDGLSDSWEEEHGLSTDDQDTDGDGWGDYEEVFGFADPLDFDDHPYIGGWPRGPVPDDLQGSGTSPGSVAPNWSLTDQFGEQVNLWSFYGQVILIESVAEW